MVSIMSFMGPIACLFSRRCWANLDLPYLFLKSRVFSEAGVKGPACLSCVFHVAGGAGNLVNSGFLIFTLLGVVAVFSH